jgi:cDNA FLJ45705 fis, clone FEBRA2028222, highly similar to homo sapiens acidic repeat containing (ACRC), mRNA
MNEKFDYKDSLTDIKASLFDIYEDQERVIGSINPDLRDKHVSEFIEIKDLALSLLEKIQKLYDNSLVSVKDNNEKVVSTNVNSVDNMQEHDVNNNEEVNNQDVENNTLEDDQVSSDEEESNQDNNDIDEDNIQTNDEVETPDESSLDDNSDDESVQNNSDIDENNTQTADEVETPDESSLDDSSDDQGRENSDTEESEDSDSEISFDNGEDNSNKYYLLCDEDKLHFAYVSEKLFNKIKSHHVSDTEPLEEDIVSDVDTSDGNIYKKDDLPVKGIIVRNDQYMKLALSKHRQEGVLKEAKNYRIETVKRKRQEQQKIELEKAKVHLDI